MTGVRAGVLPCVASLLVAAAVATAPADIQQGTPIGRVGDETVFARDLAPSERAALERLLGLVDVAKRAALTRLEDDALLAADPSPAMLSDPVVGDREIDAFLRSAPALPAAVGPPRELAAHVLRLRARRSARSRRLEALRRGIPIEHFVASPAPEGSGAWPSVVARVGTREIRDAEVEAGARVRLFQLRSQQVVHVKRAFESYVDARLLAREAAALGTTPYTPSEADVDAELLRHGLTDDGPPERRARARELLVFRARDAQRVALMARLRAQTPVVFVPALPTPPRVEVASSRPGPGDPPVTLVAFTNLRCRICAATDAVLDAVETGPHAHEVRVLRRPVYPEAALPLLVDAMAEICASEQGVGPAWRHALLEGVASGGAVDAVAVARGLVADRDRLSRCLAEPGLQATLEAQRVEAEQLGFDEAPAFVLNGLPLLGFQGHARLEQMIAAELGAPAQPQRSTPPAAVTAATSRRP